VFYAKLPVTSVKNWSDYVKGLRAVVKRPPFAMITEISTRPDKNTQFKVLFRSVAPLADEYRDGIMQKRLVVQEQIQFPYSKATEAEAAPAPATKSEKY
jgi:hypothetical protein